MKIISDYPLKKLNYWQISKGKKGRHRQVIDIIVYSSRFLQFYQEFLPCC